MKRFLLTAMIAGLASPGIAFHAAAQTAPTVQSAPAAPQADTAAVPTATPAGQEGATRPTEPTQLVNVSELEGVDVYSATNEKVGKIDRIVADTDNRAFAVITDGGFFGLGKDRLVLPISRLSMQDGRLMISGLTEPDIDRIDGLRYVEKNYARVEQPQRVEVPVAN